MFDIVNLIIGFSLWKKEVRMWYAPVMIYYSIDLTLCLGAYIGALDYTLALTLILTTQLILWVIWYFMYQVGKKKYL